MKTTITKFIEIDMGHRVPNHKSKCRNIHGHRYKIEAVVHDKVITKEGASDEGMVMDFGDLKQIMMEEIDAKYDHGFVMYDGDEFVKDFRVFKQLGQKIIFTTFIPTAENLAKLWFHTIKNKLLEKGIKLKGLRVWETPSSTAYYEE